MIFRLYSLRFSFVALEPIDFTKVHAANTLRGALGTLFRRTVCAPECPGPTTCERRASCPYACFFEPSAAARGPSGLANWPRPFVFRAAHLNGRKFAAGARLHFDLNLFETKTPAIAYLAMTFAELARDGLGPGRRRVQLVSVAQLNDKGEVSSLVYEGGAMGLPQQSEPLAFDLDAPLQQVSRVRVQFLTPTELKGGKHMSTRPEFGLLAARIRDRISTLREFYGGGALQIDFQAFGHRAARIEMIHCETVRVDAQRRSSRTGQVHPIDGFLGEADYQGDLAEFVPYLILAQWTGVGRQTVWGKGAIVVRFSNRPLVS